MNRTGSTDDRRIKDFHGGIELIHKKNFNLSGIEDFSKVITFNPEKVFIPLQQHIGAPGNPIVKQGDYVKVGQIVGELEGKISANVHASVSGSVTGIEKRVQAGGKKVECVVIENDGQNNTVSVLPYKGNPEELSGEQIAQCAEHAGIVGLGGATFPSHVKLSPREDINTVVFNGAECEPLLMADAAQMYNESDLFLEGCVATLKAVEASKGIIGIEEDKVESIGAVKKAAEGYSDIEVIVVPSRYPQGATEMLVHTVTGKEIPIGSSSRDLGILVINVATVISLARALKTGCPLTHRMCSVVGDIKNPRNVYFPLGTRAGDLIEFCGGFTGNPSKVTMGGLMMGKSLETLESSLTKAANGLVVINEENDDTEFEETPCIKCGRCVYVCPMKLLPYQLDDFARIKRWDRLESLKSEACINCGCCTYICPSKRKLAETITNANDELKERSK